MSAFTYHLHHTTGAVHREDLDYLGRPTEGCCVPEHQRSKVVVIDPEDREQVERFCKLLDELSGFENRWNEMVPALREFANPTPPKPPEPMGLGAVVQDAKGLTWLRRHPGGPAWVNGYESWKPWDEIHVVRVLSEGVAL